MTFVEIFDTRKKRKSTSERKQSKNEVKQKISNIERALVLLEDEISESLSEEASDQVPKKCFGRNQLKESAIGIGGLITDDLRRKVWPHLLNIDLVETSALTSLISVQLLITCR